MSLTQQLKRINRKNIAKKGWGIYKSGYQRYLMPSGEAKSILLIFGSQRSGTTLMTELLGRDINSKVYPEFSKLSIWEESRWGLRLKPLQQVEEIIKKDHASLIVLKPLAETQNAAAILDYFKSAHALWMYRHYQDVAVSKLKKSGLQNGIRDMQFIVEQRDSWRSENIPDHIRELVLRYYSPSMNPYDAAALYWYVRNNFLYEQALDKDDRVLMCKYEDFVTNPLQEMKSIYKFTSRSFPGYDPSDSVHSSSIGKGSGVELSPAIVRLCDDMLDRLDGTYRARRSSFA